jgi:hypothetical protein
MNFAQTLSASGVKSGVDGRIYWLLDESHFVVVSADFHGMRLLLIGPARAVAAMALSIRVVVYIVVDDFGKETR